MRWGAHYPVKTPAARHGCRRENTGTSFHNHNIGTTECCPEKTKIYPTTEADRLPELVSSERAFGSLVLININFVSLS